MGKQNLRVLHSAIVLSSLESMRNKNNGVGGEEAELRIDHTTSMSVTSVSL
jgi:hypothetical protein